MKGISQMLVRNDRVFMMCYGDGSEVIENCSNIVKQNESNVPHRTSNGENEDGIS